ncbi:hypothetical protein ACRCJ1_07940 [Aerococcus sp. L_4]
MRNNQHQGLTDEEDQAKVVEGQVNQTKPVILPRRRRLKLLKRMFLPYLMH